MLLFWYFVWILTIVAIGCLLLPWLRTIPGLDKLPVLPWQAPLVAGLLIGVALLFYRWLGESDLAPSTPHPVAAASTGIGVAAPFPASGASKAGSMQTAILSLEARLAKGGGTSDDWELLAKSYDFTGEPEAAARARRHELTIGGAAGGVTTADVGTTAGGDATAGGGVQATPEPGGAAVSGEVTVADSLRTRVPAGATLFLVAKSVDSPGAPVAAYRVRVGNWPLRFSLDDANAMLPGRNLSSAHRVTVEARISRSGEALPASGDLRGRSGVITPPQHALKIVIDEVVP